MKFWSLSIVLILLTSCTPPKSYHNAEGKVWNTLYHISYNADRDLHDSIISVMKEVEMSLSPFAEQSLISKINNGENMSADKYLTAVFKKSQEINFNSNGMFDPTVAPLINLWGFGYNKSDEAPTQDVIDSIKDLVGIDQCKMTATGKIIKKHPCTEFNFSAITKGLGCDAVGEMLERNGCDDYMIEIGGEIAVSGNSSKGNGWRIMIDTPIMSDSIVIHKKLAVIHVTDCGIATSGNYRNYKKTENGKVWHTISPVTGYPAATDILSATIKAPTCMEADAYATACMAMDASSALKMIEKAKGVEALIVTRESILTTSGFPKLER